MSTLQECLTMWSYPKYMDDGHCEQQSERRSLPNEENLQPHCKMQHIIRSVFCLPKLSRFVCSLVVNCIDN